MHATENIFCLIGLYLKIATSTPLIKPKVNDHDFELLVELERVDLRVAGLTAESVSLDDNFLTPRMLAFSVSLASSLALLRSFRHWESLAAAVLFRDERDVLLLTLAVFVAAVTAVESSSDLATAAAAVGSL